MPFPCNELNLISYILLITCSQNDTQQKIVKSGLQPFFFFFLVGGGGGSFFFLKQTLSLPLGLPLIHNGGQNGDDKSYFP